MENDKSEEAWYNTWNLQGSEGEGGAADYFCNTSHLLCYDENLVNENNGIRIVGVVTLLDMS